MLPELEQRLISIRRHLHQYPELSREEFETTKSIKSWLQEEGIISRSTSLQTGVFADIVGAEPGPTVAIRADIDALPIKEETNLPYASKVSGKMHACGHDFHTTALIGAAYLFKQNQQEFAGTIRLIFQPAEEIGAGAQKVVRDGQLDGVDAIIGLHNKPDLPVGTIGLKEGPLMAAVDRFTVKIKGIGGHAGLPQKATDPIVASAQMITALQSIVSRNVSPLDQAVVSVTKIVGGSTWNVIPGEVELEGTVRTFDTETRKQVKKRFYEITESIGQAYQVDAAVRWFAGAPPVSNDAWVTEIAKEAAESAGLQIIEPALSTAGEDFSMYQQDIPGSFAFFGTSGTEDWHHPAFTLDETAIIKAAEYLYTSGSTLLKELHQKQRVTS
ncbi:amidohydrolase [Alkalicoccobacillus murimartini]|uniref:amidohydrolase n=1 Tax=Alkalicoccobacillus murimartini TaxID=171685 RepID=UPI00351F8606